MTDIDTFKTTLNNFSNDEDSFIKLVTNYSCSQRLQLIKEYQQKFNINILDDIKKILVEKYNDLMTALFTEPAEFDAECLKDSIKENEKDIDTILEIITNKPNWLIKKIKKKFKAKYSEDFEDIIKKSFDEIIQNFLLLLINPEKDDKKEFNIEESKSQAKELFEAKDDNIIQIFNKIIKTSSPKELSIIVREYYKLSNKTILDFINENIPKEIINYVHSVIFLNISPSEYFAKKINSIIQQLHEPNKMKIFIRILVNRAELDLKEIKEYYTILFKKNLSDDIKENILGDYQLALIELCSHS